MRSQSSYKVISIEADAVRIRDLNDGLSVTNDAERVVENLRGWGILKDGQRLEYYDSDGRLDEITFDENGFTGFKLIGG